MTTKSYETLLRDAEDRKRAAERRVSDAVRGVKDLQALAEAAGRTTLTADESERTRTLMDAKRTAADDVSKADGELEALRRMQADDAETDRLLATRDESYHPIGITGAQ